MTTGKTIALTIRIFVSKVMSLLFNMLSRLVIAFVPRSKCLLISWLQSLSSVILEPKKIKSVTVFIICISYKKGGASFLTLQEGRGLSLIFPDLHSIPSILQMHSELLFNE